MPEDARREIVRFEEGGFDPDKFHHRDHVRIGFEMLRQRPFTEAVHRFASGLRAMALKAGRPHVYHETITVAFLALIAERMERVENQDFRAFEQTNPDLFEKAILHRWYSAGRLGSEIARKRFILPEPTKCPECASSDGSSSTDGFSSASYAFRAPRPSLRRDIWLATE